MIYEIKILIYNLNCLLLAEDVYRKYLNYRQVLFNIVRLNILGGYYL